MDIVQKLRSQRTMSMFAKIEHLYEALNHDRREAADEIARLRAEIDNIKQVEFPRRVDKIADVWRNKCDLAESEIARLRDENAKLREDQEECDALRGKMADILTRTATSLRGEPEPLHLHSWHDLPERVTAVMNALAGAMELASAQVAHDSDCATHNEPAYPNGPCDCSAAMQAKPTPEDPRVMARFDDGRPMITYHRVAIRKGE